VVICLRPHPEYPMPVDKSADNLDPQFYRIGHHDHHFATRSGLGDRRPERFEQRPIGRSELPAIGAGAPRVAPAAMTTMSPAISSGSPAISMVGALSSKASSRSHRSARSLRSPPSCARLAPRFAWKFWVATPLELSSAGVLMCAGWPNEASNPPHRLPVGGTYPKVMVANPTYDPVTPLINAVSVWLQLPEARLLIADSDGRQSLRSR
jgi:hypothetical protein